MKFLQRLLDFYIQSSIHVGFAVFCLVKITEITVNINPNPLLAVFIFFAAILGYNFLKYVEVFWKGNYHSAKYYSILFVSIFSLFGLIYQFINLPNAIQMHLFVSAILVLIYPFIRKYGMLKLFFVSLVVTYITVFIPFANAKVIEMDLVIHFIQRFLVLSSLLIPFEIMDSFQDPISLQTFPQKYGINKTKLFGMLFIIPFMILEFLKTKSSLISLFIGLVTVIFIHFSSKQRNKYYTNFWVESVPIFWLILLLIWQ
ncbi:hypothetical protein [Flavobacterium sp.]|jgi:hypothetical protein|uniref:hypothetical protein n=1 Tax=Flavobacterium sp. TaxID=239 RepID=UPI0037BFF1AF